MKKVEFNVGPVTTKRAERIAPEFVKYIQGDLKMLKHCDPSRVEFKKGQFVLVADRTNPSKPKFIIAKVTKVGRDAMNGPLVRVKDHVSSRRVDVLSPVVKPERQPIGHTEKCNDPKCRGNCGNTGAYKTKRAKAIKKVVCRDTNSAFGIVKGQVAEVLKSYFANGEGNYTLRFEDGTVKESPDIFWDGVKEWVLTKAQKELFDWGTEQCAVKDTKKRAAGSYLSGDEKLDLKTKEYKGFKVGTIIYQDNMFEYNDYKEVVLVAFSAPLGRTEVFRRMVVAYTYKGERQVISQPETLYRLTNEPEEVPKCKYCGRRPQNKMNHGACNSARCRLQAMRDTM